MNLECRYFKKCGGCSTNNKIYTSHLDQKINIFKDLWSKNFNTALPHIDVSTLDSLNNRSKTDITIDTSQEKIKVGFYEQHTKNLLDIENCPLLTKSLQKLYIQFREVIFQSHPSLKSKKGSARIRVSPQDKKGLWLDFSNEDIRYLLQERLLLQNLFKIFDVIEIGQKRKFLNPEILKLTEPQAFTWFETYTGEETIPLYTYISSFTQTGFKANRLLILKLEDYIKDLDVITWFEACSGSGNFTIPLAKASQRVIATELDSRALMNIQKTLQNNNLESIRTAAQKIEFYTRNIHKKDIQTEKLLSQCNGIFVDPPRSGLQNFTDNLKSIIVKPKYFIYVSCHSESMIQDFKRLFQLGYKLQKIAAIDQFPFSSHCEWISLLEI